MTALPLEVIDIILSYIAEEDYAYQVSRRVERMKTGKRCPPANTIACLRLVNKSFCTLMSRHLFRNVMVEIPKYERLAKICSSEYAGYVRQLEIGFGSRDEGLLEHIDLLATSITKLRNIEALQVTLGASIDYPDSKIQLLLHSILQCAATTPRLTSLKLTLPTLDMFTGSVLYTLQEPLEQVLRQLRHLQIGSWYSGRVFMHGGSPASPRLNFTTWFLGLVESAVHDQATRFVPLERPVSPALHLETLHLEASSVSFQTLVSVLEQVKHLICLLNFRNVTLIDGAWHDILSLAIQMPKLTEFTFIDCKSPAPFSTHFTRTNFTFPLLTPLHLKPQILKSYLLSWCKVAAAAPLDFIRQHTDPRNFWAIKPASADRNGQSWQDQVRAMYKQFEIQYQHHHHNNNFPMTTTTIDIVEKRARSLAKFAILPKELKPVCRTLLRHVDANRKARGMKPMLDLGPDLYAWNTVGLEG
ncbi:uncharacterized protein BO97DRAFT_445935 [Aspergillus homomorphus CBS 101889]|uniref:Uncharacterized protein n=1 Tax=Aspergillus homomorphus (strain CBS 101889) TaxID=1450537 RepID=A0A395HLT7_ASPHC|nr:hypothetical protein BO97DRAFT_445935 [Aspergillus homomorphus CBS 101889]RAL08730.1 hypothetical protein BO97DRAFT_445935 [Aspergillus homomorphus CBS 101889]